MLIADDDQLMRAGLRLIIEQADDLIVGAEAENGQQAVAAVHAQRPDVVVMDVRMPVMDGIEAARQITATPQPPTVLILTTFELDEYVFTGLKAGASGFLLKRSPPEQLVEGIRTVAAGESLLSPSVTRRLITEFTAHRRARKENPRFGHLTLREREVLTGMARGLSNDELVTELHISGNTVKTHVKRVLSKLGARDRVQAVVMAYEGGLMD